MILKNFNGFIDKMEKSDQNLFKDFTTFLKKTLDGKLADLDFTYSDLDDIAVQTRGYLNSSHNEIIKEMDNFCVDSLKERNQLLEDAIDFTYLNQFTNSTRLIPILDNHTSLLDLYRKLLVDKAAPLTNEELSAYIRDNKNLNNILSKLVNSSLFSELILNRGLAKKQKCLEEGVISTINARKPLSPRKHFDTIYVQSNQPQPFEPENENVFFTPEVTDRINTLQRFYKFNKSGPITVTSRLNKEVGDMTISGKSNEEANKLNKLNKP